MSENPDPVWQRLDDELTRRGELRRMPGSWADLARILDTTEQRLNNWKRRGVPARAYGEVADAIGWTVDQVAGRAEVPRAVQISLADALASLGSALAAPLTEDVRQDVADLLAKLAIRHGTERHQSEIVALLESVHAPAMLTAQTGGEAGDLAHAASQQRQDTSPAIPQVLGGGHQPQGGDEWKQRGKRIGPNIRPINATTGKKPKRGAEKSK